MTLNLVNDLFRFVTIRPPQKMKEANKRYYFLRYDATSFSGTLYDDLLEIIEDPTLNDAQKRVAAFSAAETWRDNNTDYIGTVAAVANSFDKHHKLRQLINSYYGFSNAELSQAYSDLSMTGLTTEEQTRLWDNVFVYSIIGGKADAFEAIQNVLQTEYLCDIALNPEDLVTDTDLLHQLSQATLLLPNTIFPLPRVPANALETIEEDNSAAEIRAESLAAIVELQKAGQELNRYHKRIFEKSRLKPISEDPNEPLPKPFNLLDLTIIATLSEDTQTVLAALNMEENEMLTMAYIKDWIEEQIRDHAEKVFHTITAYDKVIPVSGGLMLKSVTPSDATPPPVPVNEYLPELTIWDEFYGKDSACRIKPIGIADLRIVRQKWKCYKPGEVAHIENILKGSAKERTTRRLVRTEETTIVTTEKEKEEERDTQSTERYELSTETSNVINQDNQFNISGGVNANFNGGFGSVNVFANTGFSNSTSTQQSNSQAVNYAKSVTERAVQRIFERVVEERRFTRIEEFEETNKISQTAPTDAHIVGIYRWVDKYYDCYVENYGKRTMFQFLVPEPAAFYLDSLEKKAAMEAMVLEKPIHPGDEAVAAAYGIPCGGLRSHVFVQPGFYHLYAAAYGAEVSPPPAYTLTIGKAIEKQSDLSGGTQSRSLAINDIQIPEGYMAKRAFVKAKLMGTHLEGLFLMPQGVVNSFVQVQVGAAKLISTSPYLGANEDVLIAQPALSSNPNTYFQTVLLNNERNTIPVSALVVGSAIINITIECEYSPELYEQWQIDTYDAIMTGYQRKKLEYEAALSDLQYKQSGGPNLENNNPPDLNREIEMTELKKQCIALMRHGYGIPLEFDTCFI